MFIRTLICLFSFTIALVFGNVTTAVYGVEAISELSWIDNVFWALMASGPLGLSIAWTRDWILRHLDPGRSIGSAQEIESPVN